MSNVNRAKNYLSDFTKSSVVDLPIRRFSQLTEEGHRDSVFG